MFSLCAACFRFMVELSTVWRMYYCLQVVSCYIQLTTCKQTATVKTWEILNTETRSQLWATTQVLETLIQGSMSYHQKEWWNGISNHSCFLLYSPNICFCFFFYTVKNMYMLQINSYIDHETWQRFICSVTVQNRQYFFASEDKITNNNNNKNERHNYQWCFNCTIPST